MKHERIVARRAANVSLPVDLLDSAKELGVNVSRACAQGLAVEVKKVREAKWIEEHREIIESWNAWVDEHGLPLAKYRQF